VLEITESLDTKEKAETPLTFRNGCHIAEVEIDPDTGAVDLAGPIPRSMIRAMLDPSLSKPGSV
jgi:hypothetical protein